MYQKEVSIDKSERGLFVIDFVSTKTYDSTAGVLPVGRLSGIIRVGFAKSRYDFRYPPTLIIRKPKSRPIAVFFGVEPFNKVDEKLMEKFIKSIGKDLDSNANIAYPSKMYNFINNSVVPKQY